MIELASFSFCGGTEIFMLISAQRQVKLWDKRRLVILRKTFHIKNPDFGLVFLLLLFTFLSIHNVFEKRKASLKLE
jgi:hypothetical protein